MTTGGLHLLSGLFISSLIRDEKYKKMKWGIVWGVVLPDIDLIASVITFLVTGDVVLSSQIVHRSVTHGFFAIGLILMLGLFISNIKPEYKWFSIFSIGFAFGMSMHLFFDLLDGYVAVLAPFSFARYSITGFDYQTSFGETSFKVWNAFDAISDSIPYLFIWYWSTKKGNFEHEQKFAKKLRIISLISLVYFGFLMILALTPISFEIHYALIFILYAPIIVPISTVILHLKMRDSIQEFSFFDLKA